MNTWAKLHPSMTADKYNEVVARLQEEGIYPESATKTD